MAEQKVKTMGIFEIKSTGNEDFSFKGASTQIEVCTKDYISWCKNGKAPPILQAEYDKSLGACTFIVSILREVQTPEELAEAKVDYGLKSGGKPRISVNSSGEQTFDKVAKVSKPAKEKIEEIIVAKTADSVARIDVKHMLKSYKEGISVDTLCRMNGISHSQFYDIKEGNYKKKEVKKYD